MRKDGEADRHVTGPAVRSSQYYITPDMIQCCRHLSSLQTDLSITDRSAASAARPIIQAHCNTLKKIKRDLNKER